MRGMLQSYFEKNFVDRSVLRNLFESWSVLICTHHRLLSTSSRSSAISVASSAMAPYDIIKQGYLLLLTGKKGAFQRKVRLYSDLLCIRWAISVPFPSEMDQVLVFVHRRRHAVSNDLFQEWRAVYCQRKERWFYQIWWLPVVQRDRSAGINVEECNGCQHSQTTVHYGCRKQVSHCSVLSSVWWVIVGGLKQQCY